ncbi:MAG: tetratricopeptide repeat protein [Eubacteriales bacterium]
MKCYHCGLALSEKSYCTSCGSDVYLYKRIMNISNLFYNQGLEKANVRDLSGAITSLKQSLKFNKDNIMARNLLGLVYFEMGQTAEALCEWVISKNVIGEKNIADDYLNAIQNNPTRFATISTTIKKYNIALEYCNQDSKDLAIIQLKKVLSTNPKFVLAHQLLGMLYAELGNYAGAIKEFEKCLKIDVNNTRALRLLKELEVIEVEKSESNSKKNKKAKRQKVHQYQSGNETIIQPINDRDVFNLHVIVNLVVGVVIGISIGYFLILPTQIKEVNQEVNEQLNEMSQQALVKSARIAELEQQLENALTLTGTLQSEVDIYLGENGKVELTDQLLNATYIYLNTPTQMEDIAYSLEYITNDFIEEQASSEFTALYNYLISRVGVNIATSYYNTGYTDYRAEDYEAAIPNFEKAYQFNPTNGEAIYNLANSYANLGEIELAITAYEEVIIKFPYTEKARKSQEYLDTYSY